MYGYQEMITKNGALVLMGNRKRVAHTNRAWGYYDAVWLVWINQDHQELSREFVALGKFFKEHKPKSTGFQRVYDAGTQRYV